MTPFTKGKWIWTDHNECEDQYTEYIDTIGKADKQTMLYLSCDTDYTLFINDRYVASNQYGDFEHYKIYDTIDVTPYLINDDNSIRIIVYYCGVNTSRYRKARAGLIYEFQCDGNTVAHSDVGTLSRVHPAYISGQKRFITGQLGFSFTYDATKETDDGYSPSVIIDKNTVFFPRPTEKLRVLPMRQIKEIQQQPWGYTIDLGSEVVGFATLDIVSPCEQLLTVCYGESLDDGRIRRKIGNRDFSFEYKAKAGQNSFTNHMLRLSCRYIEVICDRPIDINYVSILPQIHHVEEKPCIIESELDRRIYDISVNTLRLCMMEHYVDTPWREQCLYAFDSRNQMLCGYYAFKDGNAQYARSNLKLIGQDLRQDDLLSICYPCGIDLTIPSFSLYYIIAMKEYMEHTADTSLAKEIIPKIETVCDEFIRNSPNGLIQKFQGKQHWNFYDWAEHLEGSLGRAESSVPDIVINCLFVMALDSLEAMCNKTSTEFKYSGMADALRKRIREEFASDAVLLTHVKGGNIYTTLGNSLAVLCKAVTGHDALNICDEIVAGNTTPSSLSMNIWKYEALMTTDAEKYRNYILDEIRATYKIMLDAGSTTVWETAKGSVDFGNAGSLCHGWSAVPVYIFHRLGVAKN